MADLQATAQRFHSVIYEPRFEKTAAEVEQSTTNAIEEFKTALDIIGCRKPEEATFANTLQAMDQAQWEITKVRYRLALLQNAGTNSAVRNAAAEAARKFSRALVDAGYRSELYGAVKAVAKSGTKLEGEDARLLRDYLQSGKRVGLDLNLDRQEHIKELWKELAEAQLSFLKNLSAPAPRVKFSQAELKGATETFLDQDCAKVGHDEFIVPADIYTGYLRIEQTRKRLWLAQQTNAAAQNRKLVLRILGTRTSIAHELGYSSWADYALRGSMAGSVTNARDFCEDLSSRVRTSFDSQIAELTRLKTNETGDPNARIEPWDVAYYENQQAKYRRGPSARRLLIYFPSGHVVDGAFDVCERVFGLRIERVRTDDSWADRVSLFAVSDASSGEPLGLIYLDPFARAGKRGGYNFTTTIVPGKQLPDGRRQCPAAAIQMHFSGYKKGIRDKVWPTNVRSFYHELGHALHEILSRSRYCAFQGNDVGADYVEVPSKLFEKWIFDGGVLNVQIHRNSWYAREAIPKRVNELQKLEAEEALSYYRWASALALADLALNTEFEDGENPIALANRILSDHYLNFPPDAALIASDSNFVQYNGVAGYSYVWCEAIAADLLAEFQKAPGGLLDSDVGMRLRHEILETGNARPPKVSIEKFLGRPYSMEPFFKQHGLETPKEKQ